MSDRIITRALPPAQSNVQNLHNAPDLSALERYEPTIESGCDCCGGDTVHMEADDEGEYVLLEAVEALLSVQPAAPAKPCSPWLHPAGHYVHRHDCPEAVSNGWSRDLAPAAPAVKVKPLAWEVTESGAVVAETSIGEYSAEIPHRSWVLTASDGSMRSFVSLDAAKAAAQADYEARILAALEGGAA